jgi:hypothetical protein
MILISHRGNTNGCFESWENEPTYIDLAIKKGFDVEIDVWYKANIFFLGHNSPNYGVHFSFINERASKLWVHCKNIEAVVFLASFTNDINYFWHENDTLTLTSKKYIWGYPGKQPIKNSIAVKPELYNDNISESIGICSDFIEKYKL